jgi:hypothetical protein
VGKLASGATKKTREARGKKYVFKPGHMMGKAFIGEDSARSAEEKCVLGKQKNVAALKASRTGLV